MKSELKKIITIVGPTASGKTSLSIALAKKFNGEIISADSRQVYKGLDIGTGKVTHEEMQGVPHHMLDIADPKNKYTVHDFVRDGREVITSIHERGKLPIIVGGTFLYIDALLGKISTPEVPPNDALRQELEMLPLKALVERLEKADPKRLATIDTKNSRRLIRAIEIAETLGSVPKTEQNALYDGLTLGITIDKEELQENIHNRLVSRMNVGMVEEVQTLHKNGLSFEQLEELGIEYKFIAQHLQGKISKEEMLQQIETKSWQYARRQMTWLKRDKDIVWVNPSNLDHIFTKTQEFLS